jgi:hypothetical protein
MTNVGSVYCSRCWQFYHQNVAGMLHKLDDRLIARSISLRNTCVPPLYTTEHRRAVVAAKQPYCTRCFS